MDSSATAPSNTWHKVGGSISRFSAWPLSVWTLLGVMLFWRGAVGHYHHRLGNKLLITLAVLLPLLTMLVRWFAEAGKENVKNLAAHFLPSIALILCGVGIT